MALAPLMLALALQSPPSAASANDGWEKVMPVLLSFGRAETARALRICPLTPRPLGPVTGDILYQGDVVGMSVGASGVLAIADLRAGQVRIYPNGPSGPILTTPLSDGFTDRSLVVAPDGGRVAWIAGIPGKVFVYDLKSRTASTLAIAMRPCEAQWIGADLLVRACPNRNILFRTGPDGFRRVLVSDEAMNIHTDFLARRAVADSAGRSFVRPGHVYPTIDAALADGAAISPSGFLGNGPLRVGDALIQAGPAPNGDSSAPPKLIRLDTAAAPLALGDVVCAPRDMAAAPDGRQFALLQAGGLVQVFRADDFKVVTSYRLPGDFPDAPSHIAYLPDGRLAAQSKDRVVLFTPPK